MIEVLETYLIVWRTIALRDREVIDALVHPSHAAPSPELRAALAQWRGDYYWSNEADGRHLVLTRRTRRPAGEAWWLHAALVLATLLCTTYAGAVFQNRLDGSFTFFVSGLLSLNKWFLTSLVAGLVFSIPLIAILMAHELGHYFAARRYLLDTSPPYFIPLPLFPWFIGTLGAFIRLRTIISDRRQLLDVGLAGPVAGFLVAVPALWWGLEHSAPDARISAASGLVAYLGGPVELGNSLVTIALRHVTGTAGQTIALHPTAFAGWFGLFVTMLNLLPIAQLDGGHILYSALPRWHSRAAILFWVVLGALGYFFWVGWGFWAALILILSRGRLNHPPVLDDYRPLPRSRRWLLLAAVVLFVLTFAPVPFRI